jgi:hypothetical protein
MRWMSRLKLVIVMLGLAAVFPTSGLGQGRLDDVVGGPLTGPVVVGAPFSAQAMTTFTGVRADGTRFQRSTPAVYYRDGVGRVRVELTIEGTGPRISVQPEPDSGLVYWLDGRTRTARRILRGLEPGAFGNGRFFHLPIAFNKSLSVIRFLGVDGLLTDAAEESLGTRRIAGIEALGRRVAMTVPVGYLGNARPVEIVDERWESPELHLLVESSYSDPRFGLVEYSVSNIRRTEPSPDLFAIPDDFNNNAPDNEPWVSFIPFDKFLSGKSRSAVPSTLR